MTAPRSPATISDFRAFRAQFPALERLVWLNTPTLAPGARPVLEALRRVEAEWETGELSWQAWEAEGHATRGLFARLLGVDEGSVALVSFVAQAAATVAASLPVGKVVVGAREFHSNLLPWLGLRGRGFDVQEVPDEDGVVRTERLAEAVDEGTVLVAVSEVQSSTGFRVRLEDLAKRCREHGTRLFVNLTQSLGALRFVADAEPDFVAVHGYKWLLAPRGAAWLYVRPDRLEEIRPLAPNWKSLEHPYEDYYGGSLDRLAGDARKLDSTLPWFPWAGARAALDLLLSLDAAAVEDRCLELSRTFREEAAARGFALVPEDAPSQIVGVSVPDADGVRERLKERRVLAAVRGGFLRLGFHAFNDEEDVAAALAALGRP